MTHRTSAPLSRRSVTDPARPARPRLGTWLIATVLCLGVAAAAVTPYLLSGLDDLARSGSGLASNYAHRSLPLQVALYVHAVAGGVALVLVPWQYSARLRRRSPGAHRAIGRIVLAALVVAGVAGLVIAPVSRAGFLGLLGFSVLATSWLYCAWRTYRTVVAGDLRAHRAWAARTFALTFAAVTLRLWLGGSIAIEVGVFGRTTEQAFDDVYPAMPFLCWVPNLAVAEYLIRRRGAVLG